MPSDAPLVLAFDTSAAQCAAALVSGDTVLAQKSEPMTRGQAERLFPLLEELLAEAGRTWGDLARLGVCIGPGNFTGVRISVAAARGVALARGIPAVGVTTFEVLTQGTSGPLTVVLDGRRGQVFTQVFQDGIASADPARTTLEAVPPAPAYAGFAAGELAARNAARALGEDARVDPVVLARLAAQKSATTRPAPLYLRPADAALPADPPPVILP